MHILINQNHNPNRYVKHLFITLGNSIQIGNFKIYSLLFYNEIAGKNNKTCKRKLFLQIDQERQDNASTIYIIV